MIYQTTSMKLKKTGVVLEGAVNDVIVCRKMTEEESETGRERLAETYIVWILRERKIIRYLLEPENSLPWLDYFPLGENFCLLFPCEKKRPLFRYWNLKEEGTLYRNLLCRDFISFCMTLGFPWPVLYLFLKQLLFHIREDGTFYITYELDLSEFDSGRTEQDCIKVCIEILNSFLDPEEKADRRKKQLMEKKLSRGRYRIFMDVYLDWKKPTEKRKKNQLSESMKVRIFYLLSACAALLVLLLMLILISQLVFGWVPIFHFFQETFEQIGTELLGR